MIPDALLAQNPDGGWGAYPGGCSWTEPTAWAVLALDGWMPDGDWKRRAAAWLRSTQLPDGNWSANRTTEAPGWTGSVVTLLQPALLGEAVFRRGLSAVAAAAQSPPLWADRVRRWMLGLKPSSGPPARGWPWLPGTAAWVIPTALSMLALHKDKPSRERHRHLLEDASNYLLARQCRDGGWNHGSSQALGYDSDSYPETTGLALLALRGARGPAIDRALAVAEHHAADCSTREGADWIRLALAAHGRPLAATRRLPVAARDVRGAAIALVVDRCLAGEPLLWTD